MKRYDHNLAGEFSHMWPAADGEWVRYEDHVEAMKRIAAAPVAQGLDVDAVMTKIQEFASTWAVVGGRFDDGTAMECAEECKAEIRAILAQSAPSASAQQASPDEDDEESEGAVMPVHWDLFPGWLIDHHEGDTITEELLQSALADMLKVHPAAPAPAASPAALTDEQIIALADRGEHLTPSPSKYPELGHGTQYHCGAPGLLGFARALLAASPVDQVDAQPSEDKRTAELVDTLRLIYCLAEGGTTGNIRKAIAKAAREAIDAAMIATPPAAETQFTESRV